MEAFWKPQSPGSDPRPPAETMPEAGSTGRHPNSTRRRPPSRALCKQEVTGSIPVGSIHENTPNYTTLAYWPWERERLVAV